MSSGIRFRVKSSRLIHETFDDEVVIVDLDSGSYYSINKVGADLWGFIEHGSTIGEMVQGIGRRYEANGSEIECGVKQFLAELQQENLVASETVTELDAPDNPSAQSEPKGAKSGFETPRLCKYTDMQELLLLDPIHEVDETGWPSRPQGGSGARG